MIDERYLPEILGACMAMITAALRVVYTREETTPARVALESVICGCLSVCASSAIYALGLNHEWAVFAGGTIGYFGSATVRAVALKVINKKI